MRITHIKKAIFIILALSLLFIYKTNFIKQYKTDEEVINIFSELKDKSINVYQIFWTGGLENNSSIQIKLYDTIYSPVVDNYPYNNIQAIKDFTESVFTKSAAAENFYSYFELGGDTSPLYIDIENKLYVNINAGGKGWGRDFNLNKIEILSQNKDTIIFKIGTTLFEEKSEDLIVELKNVNGDWRLNSPIL